MKTDAEHSSPPARSCTEPFIEQLYKEKAIHKEHRHKHLMHKLVLSSTFFGLGQFDQQHRVFHLFLYVAPLIALIHDLYIIAEDHKVKRIGQFLRERLSKLAPCKLEKAWEEFVKAGREPWGAIASMVYTLLLTGFTAAAVFIMDFQSGQTSILFFIIWIVVCVALNIFVFAGIAGVRMKPFYKTPYDKPEPVA
jgi:hypothetical protein